MVKNRGRLCALHERKLYAGPPWAEKRDFFAMNRRIRLLPIVLAIGALAWFYFSSPTFINPETGRKSKVGLSESQEQTLGLQSFQQVLSQSQTIQSGADYDLVVKVERRLIGVVDEGARSFQWKVALVQSDQQNAFCLTGGEIVVYTGILPVTQSEAGLATVLGHEIAHATSPHGAQRIFQQDALQIALSGVQGSIAAFDDRARRQVLGLLGGRCAIRSAIALQSRTRT